MAEADAPATCPDGHEGARRLLPLFSTIVLAAEPNRGLCGAPEPGLCGRGSSGSGSGSSSGCACC
jgi:hypothetical protein